ncbi:TetR/AcrR family transcriptional regulator [Glycomyces tenuis]|uniref:TetR/AcrR family transcriptional regulator n=1 Tax=Glycomyces tenuis TaxID=58116 RepID=UPI00041034D0|nr:TetR/AcrR family transcriptional regulator [Glycomyces tenuis]
MPSVTQRGERIDAQRNRQNVLDTADRLVAERGTAVTLGEIAAAAGLGAGTVYRHFPTKDALMATVLDRRLVDLGERAWAAGRRAEPGEAFFDFLRYAADQALENRALCEALAGRGEWTEPSKLEGKCVIDAPFAELLARAQRAGAVRADVTHRDVMALLPGFVAMATALGSSERAHRLADMLWEGLRPTMERNTEISNETWPAAEKRNENWTVSGDETERRCRQCGDPIEAAGAGRPPKYCSAACRQKAFREKRKTAAPTAAPAKA